MGNKKRSVEENRRYKLHQKIKNVFEYYAKKKTVIIPYDHDLQDPFVLELRDKFRYNIQYSIISPNDINVNEAIIYNN